MSTTEARRSKSFKLVVVSSATDGAGAEFEVSGGESLTIGREPGCSVTLNDRSVSRRHASVTATPEGLKVADLASGNGVWIGDHRVKETVVQPGQQFRVGSTVFECRVEGASAPVEPVRPVEPKVAASVAAPPAPAARTATAPDPEAGFIIRVLSADGETEIRVQGLSATIGRVDTCTVTLATKDVSRLHAEIRMTNDGFRIIDNGSTNGIWVDDRRVEEGTIRPGQKFRIGNTAVLVCETLGGRAEAATPARVPEKTPTPAAPPRPPVPPTKDLPSISRSSVADSPKAPPVEALGGATRHLERPTDLAPPKVEREPREPVPPKPERSTPAPVNPGATRIASAAELGHVQETGAQKSKAEPVENFTRVVERPAGLERRPPPPPQPKKRVAEKDSLPADMTRFVERAEAARAAEDQEAARSVAEEAFRTIDLSRSVVIPVKPPAKDGAALPIEKAGERIEVGAHQPFLLDDPDCAWYVVTGGVDIFTVALEKNLPKGTRSHFLGVLAGQLFFGFDLVAAVSGFLAVAKQGTELRKIPIEQAGEMANRPDGQNSMAALIENWLTGLNKALVRDMASERAEEIRLRPRETVEIEAGKKATSDEGVLWVPISSGEILFNDMGEPTFSEKQVLFPVTPDSWIEPLASEFGNFKCTPLPTSGVIRRPNFWDSLATYHESIREFEFVNKRFAAADEWQRLRQKDFHAQRAQEEAVANIAGVLEQGGTPKSFLATGATEPVLRACRLVGDALGMEVKRHPSADDRLTYEEKVSAIAIASGFRTRVVALRDEWWTTDHGPLLAQDEVTKAPLALIPPNKTSYEIVDPKTGTRTAVDGQTAERLSSFAYTFYRPFPDGELGVMDLVRFGAQGLISDYRTLVMMGVVVGMFGTVTPYLTGRIYDAAIPQADRGMLLGFGIALFGAALASSVFKFVQGVATVRVSGKMEYSIQAALWDRLLNLPANFFRQYSTGDLTDRVNGIDQIQQLVSGAGVAAVLGSVSGMFYVFQMFMYNLMLAALAVGLTLCFVAVTSLCNYLQLKHQRVEIQVRGRISGLVLNLITGVTKLRVSGAENHAFRVWATEFSKQRKISFSVGQIQNAATVFSKLFPVLSSMAIFGVMILEQAKAAEAGTPGLTTGDFIAFNAAYGLFLAAMQSLADASLNMLRVVPVYERLQPIITTPAEIDATKVFPGKLKGEIKLSHIHFRYSEDGPWIVKDLTLDIDAGEMVAFVGGSGCGKSTLMRLMLGFEGPAMGAIYYDGQDLASLDTRMVRQQMGVVLQQSRVMPTELYRNIIGVSSRSMEEAWEAAEKSGLAEDIRAMPMGMHTYVSEGGGTLSGGQRQRLMIARAVVNKPKVMFLDEATSALDNRAQSVVTESLDRMDATRIVIAHRLSTVINADKICYLEAGRIVEMGTYQELMEKDGLFAQLAKRQMA